MACSLAETLFRVFCSFRRFLRKWKNTSRSQSPAFKHFSNKFYKTWIFFTAFLVVFCRNETAYGFIRVFYEKGYIVGTPTTSFLDR